MTDDIDLRQEIERFRAKRRRPVRKILNSYEKYSNLFDLQEQTESDDEFKMDDDESETISTNTSENLYVPLKERRRQQVSSV